MKIIERVIELENEGRRNMGITNPQGFLTVKDKKFFIAHCCPSTYGFHDSCVDKIRSTTKCGKCFNNKV